MILTKTDAFYVIQRQRNADICDVRKDTSKTTRLWIISWYIFKTNDMMEKKTEFSHYRPRPSVFSTKRFPPISSWTEWRHEYAARLLSTIQNGGARCRSLGFFGGKFHKDRTHSVLKLRKRYVAQLNVYFLLVITKRYAFWSDLVL